MQGEQLIVKMGTFTQYINTARFGCGLDCQNNEKWYVWLDYEKKVINLEFVD